MEKRWKQKLSKNEVSWYVKVYMRIPYHSHLYFFPRHRLLHPQAYFQPPRHGVQPALLGVCTSWRNSIAIISAMTSKIVSSPTFLNSCKPDKNIYENNNVTCYITTRTQLHLIHHFQKISTKKYIFSVNRRHLHYYRYSKYIYLNIIKIVQCSSCPSSYTRWDYDARNEDMKKYFSVK